MKTVKLILLICLSFPVPAFTQNVGIGSVAPTGKLQINHRTANAIGLRLVDSTNSSAGSVEFRNVNRPVAMHVRGFTESNFNNGQYVDIFSDSTFVATFRGNGRVGVRMGTPDYPLDVNGDINTNGTLRVNGDAGSSGQVLRSNGDGTMDWRSMQFENMATFRVIGAGSWTVPAGVTKIMVEAWGAGGGGTAFGGGGGGAYIYGYFTVTPGSAVSYNIGDGGSGDHDAATNGQSTTVSIGSAFLSAAGGTVSTSSLTNINPAVGGNFTASSTSSFFGEAGETGSVSVHTFMQSGTTTFIESIVGGFGGDAGHSNNTGAQGAGFLYNISSASIMRTKFGGTARQPGGGGHGGYYSSASNFANGGAGADGMVVIRW